MPRYGYFPDSEFPQVSVSATFDRKQFGELELMGAVMQIKDAKQMLISRVGIGGSIMAAPLVNENGIYIGACDRNMYSLTLEGKEKWRFSTQDAVLTGARFHDGLLFLVSCDHNIYALDSETAKLAWKFATGGKLYIAPHVHNGIVYMGSHDGCVYALEEKTGRLKWKIVTNYPQDCVVDEERLYYGGMDNAVHACTLEGKELWAFRMQGRAILFEEPFWKNMIYVASGDDNLYALDRKTGKLIWKFRAGDQPYPPVVSGGKVYFGSRDFNVYCLDADTGRLIWKFPTGGITTYPAEAQGRVYIGSWDNNVYCLDSATGRQIWRFKTNGFVSFVKVFRNMALFGSWDCNLYCLDAGTGKVIWKFRTSLGTPSPIEPPESGMVTSAQVTWQAPEEEAKAKKNEEQQISDYADTKNEYAGAGMGDYLGKKKRGYV